MNKEKLQALAKTIKGLEDECQNGVDIEENTTKMEKLMSSLSFEELLTLADYLEE